MKNIHKFLILLISIAFVASATYAQSDMSPKLKDQSEEKVKPPKALSQEMQVLEDAEKAPGKLEQLKQVAQDREITEGYYPAELHIDAKAQPIPNSSEDLFDLQFDYPVAIGGGEAGIESDGNYIYTSMWNGAGEFQQYDTDGTWIATLTVPGSTGCRDIAYNGTYFYGGAASTTIFEMDIENGVMISTFTGPTACRAIAYNEDDDVFYCNNWSDDITAFDASGAFVSSFPTGPIGVSYYGFAYESSALCGDGPFLWGYAQTGATLNELVQMDPVAGVETGVTFDVGSVAAVGAGIAGGLAITDGLETGFYTILGTAQNENIWGLELCVSGPLPDDDLGIQSIAAPSTGVNLTASEAVTIVVKNYGNNAQSAFDVSFTLDGGTPVTESVSTTLNAGETYEHTFGVTVDLSAYGAYDFEACVTLTGDENPDNDCKDKTVENLAPSLCVPLYSTGCTVGDGFTDFAVEEIQNLGNGCADNTGFPGWSEYYGLGPATLIPGFTHTFTMGTGFGSQFVDIWIDYNDDLDLTADELILDDYEMVSAGVLYDVDIDIPANATPGQHVMRIRAKWLSPGVADPCEEYTYGEAEDYYVFVATPEYGDLEGFVTEATGGAPIEDAMVSVNNGSFTAMTASDGFYSIQDVLIGDWPIEVTKDGYNPHTGTVTIEEGLTTQYDVGMTAPTMDITPTSIDIIIDPFAQETVVVDIANNGDGPLAWNAQLELLTEGTADQWDVLLDVPVAIGGGEAGIETDGTYIYTSMWNGAGDFQQYDMAGNWIGTLNVPGSTGCRDIAYDGTYFYGGAAATTIFEMDILNETMISTFTGPTACRAIAYNEDEDIFYCNNWSDNITKFDKSGANLGNFPTGPIGVSYYGFAYDNYSMPGTPYLWGYAQTGATLNELVQIDLGTELETGFSLDVGSLVTVGAGIAGGLSIHTGVAPGVYAVIGTAQNENLWALELAAAGPVWLSIDPNSGDVNAGEVGTLNANFDATDIVAGTVKTANIHFMSDPDVGMVTIPVSMTVGDLEFGFVEGTVTLDGSAPYNIGDVTEVLVEVGPYSGFPDASGFYSIETYPGTYDVTATLYGYETTVTSDVVVDEGATVTVDLTMPCLYGIVSGTVTAADNGDPIEGAMVMVMDTEFETTTAADGSYEFTIEAGTYDVKVSAPFFASQTASVVVDPEATTTQDFSLATLEGIIVVIDLDPTPNADIVDVIQGFFPGGLVEYTTDINGYVLDEQVQTVFLLLGIYSSNYTLTETDAQVITTWIDSYDDRNLYMEGGDTWAFDAPTSLHAYFNINGVLDGSGDLANIDGIDLDWSGMDWGYVGENNWIDHLEAISPAVPVMENPDVGYFCGVAYNEGTYKTVGASFQVTGVVDATGGFNMGVASIMSFFGYDVFAYGDLEGTVTEAGSGDPVEDAVVTILGQEVMTNSDGEYLVEDLLVGTWTVTCTKDGYNPESADVTIEEDVVTVQDFELTAPEFSVDPTSISVTLDPNGMTTEEVTIDNPGTGTVNWSASLNIQGDGGDDMFDVIFDVPVGIGGGEAGIETDGTHIYTSKWNGAGEFYRYAMDGTYLETITVTGSTGCRDIAYDGTYFYGGAAATTIFEMDLANATMISTFTGPTACRAIAYNHNDDAFYCNNWSDNIVKFDKAGANLGSFPTGPVGISYYGFAYEDASGGEFLWGYAQTGATLNELVQIELPSGVETGLTFDVGSVTTVGAGIAGGLAIDDNIQAGVWAFLGTAQNENLWALELAPAGPVWISIEPNNGTLDPGGSETMDVMLNATGLLPGFYYADINFSTNPNVGSPTVEVELEVAGLIPAVNLMGIPNCTDIDLSWEMPAGGNPDSWNIYRDGVLLGNVTDMNHTDPMLDPEVMYEYTVTAVYGGDESLPTPPMEMMVEVPEDLEALNPDATHVGAGDIVITWEEPAACLLPDEYEVYRDGEPIGTTTELTFTDPGLTTGFYEYYVVAIYYFGESGPSDPAYVLVGIENPTAAEFQIYPNPASELVTIKSVFHVNTIEVLNNAGQVVYRENVEALNFNVNVSDFERGIYYFRINTDDGVLLRKVAVK